MDDVPSYLHILQTNASRSRERLDRGLTPAKRRLRRSERGWSMLESMLAMSLLTIAVVGVGAVITTSVTLVAVSRETALAMEATRQAVECMVRSAEFENLFALYNGSAQDDPPGLVAPGPCFEVEGLNPDTPNGSGAVGEIFFPASGSSPTLLSETLFDSELGMPRDLNGDGAIDTLNHASDYNLLPVRVQVRWKGVAGVRVVNYRTVLAKR